MSPNASAVANAKKICSSGSFVKLAHSSDDTFYMGECKGSGKSNYIVSADFVDEENPVIRCTCPSRQFPCKHDLLYYLKLLMKKLLKSVKYQKIYYQKEKRKKRQRLKKKVQKELKKRKKHLQRYLKQLEQRKLISR